MDKIISGGQSGADLGGLEAGKLLNIPTGGYAPKRYMTEYGVNMELKEKYNLIECSTSDYQYRTIKNIENSDGTLIFSERTSSGSKFTAHSCREMRKPYIINPSPEKFIIWLNKNKISILNVAGNRNSVSNGIGDKVKKFLITTIQGN